MIDWGEVLSHSTWLAGLALLLAVISFVDYTRKANRLPIKVLWRALFSNHWAYLGALLFCAGMALVWDSWLERAFWALLGAYVIFEWRRFPMRNAECRMQSELEPAFSIASDAHRAVPGPQEQRSHASLIKVVADWLVRTELLWLALLAFFFLYPSPGGTIFLLGCPFYGSPGASLATISSRPPPRLGYLPLDADGAGKPVCHIRHRLQPGQGNQSAVRDRSILRARRMGIQPQPPEMGSRSLRNCGRGAGHHRAAWD